MNRKLMISGALAAMALAAGGIAVAQGPDGPGHHGMRGPHHGGVVMMADANKDGNLTKAEVTKAVNDRFTAMDVNKDGKLTPEDRQLRRQQRQDAWFASADTDKNGQLSRAEFGAARDARAEGRGGPDGEGRGFGREGRGGFGKFGHGHGFGRGGFGPGRADVNKDGVVTRDEMLAQAMTMFTAADTDKDGTVTAAERQAAHEAMRAKWQERRGDRGPDDMPPPPPPPAK